jgi:pyridoxal 5'-phosphate synthase pdxS subunit
MTNERTTGTARVKRGLAEMLRGGVIMDVVTPEQAKIAEDAGASAVMALERVPSDIRRDGGVARMSDPSMIEGIQKAVTIPVMAKCRIGHFAEAQVLQSLGVDYVASGAPPPTSRTTSTSESRFPSCAVRPTSAGAAAHRRRRGSSVRRAKRAATSSRRFAPA